MATRSRKAMYADRSGNGGFYRLAEKKEGKAPAPERESNQSIAQRYSRMPSLLCDRRKERKGGQILGQGGNALTASEKKVKYCRRACAHGKEGEVTYGSGGRKSALEKENLLPNYSGGDW